MLKSDLIAVLVAKRQLTQKQAETTVETIFDAMKPVMRPKMIQPRMDKI